MKTSLTRRYHFAASHRLESPELTPAENARIYGKCNNPFGHGHDYTLEVTITGDLNPETGLILPYRQLDDLVEDKVLQLFANRNINLDVPQFARLVPTTENMALVIARILQDGWNEHFREPKTQMDEAAGLNEPKVPTLVRIHMQETDRNGFELPLNQDQQEAETPHAKESVLARA